jgi:hypothetical protein
MTENNLIKLGNYKKEVHEKEEILRWAQEQKSLQRWRFAGICVLFISALGVFMSLASLLSKLF